MRVLRLLREIKGVAYRTLKRKPYRCQKAHQEVTEKTHGRDNHTILHWWRETHIQKTAENVVQFGSMAKELYKRSLKETMDGALYICCSPNSCNVLLFVKSYD